MKIENWQLALIAIGAFAGIILLNIAIKYQTDEEFRNSFPLTKRALFAQAIAPQLNAEEHDEPVAPPYVDMAVTDDNEETQEDS